MISCSPRRGDTGTAYRVRVAVLLALTLLAAGAAFAAPRLAQPQWYHDFADQRPFLGVPHALNVLSNLPFVAVGAAGVVLVLRRRPDQAHGPFARPGERWPLLLFFAAIALTGVGSAYYHAAPGNERLVWDRLPLAVAFMALFGSVMAERLDLRAGLVTAAFVILGAGSVVYWHVTEGQGAGDLRPYLFVQLYPLAAVPVLLLLFPARYTRTADLVAALACYALAKGLELLDAQIYARGQLVSGHTLKHLVAALAAWCVFLWVKNRRPVVPQRELATCCPGAATTAQ